MYFKREEDETIRICLFDGKMELLSLLFLATSWSIVGNGASLIESQRSPAEDFRPMAGKAGEGRRRREWKSIREVSSSQFHRAGAGLESLETSSVHPLRTPFPC